MSRMIGKEISPGRSASCGIGPTLIIWCTAGVSGIAAPAIAASFGLQTPQAMTTVSASMSPPVVRTRRIRPRSTSMPVTSTVATTVSAPALERALAHDRAGAQRVDDADRRRPERAEDPVRVEERHPLDDLLRRDQLGLDAPRPRRGHPAAQLLHPLLGARDLEAAGLGEDAHLLVLAHAVERQVGDLAGVVDGEDEVRRVAGGAAGVGQRALVDLDDVAPAEAGQVVDQAVADDAGADDDHARGGRNGGHWVSPSVVQSPSSRRRRITYSCSSSRTASSSGGGSYSASFLRAISPARAAASFAPLRIHRS